MKLSARCFRKIRRYWPALLLLGLVAVEVLGACGSVRVVRRAHRTKPLEVRYHIKRTHLFWVFTLDRDTTDVELRYRGQRLQPFESCEQSSHLGTAQRRPVVENAWRQRGPEPRWLLSTVCGGQQEVYLLRLPASGPEFIRIGPLAQMYYSQRPALRPVDGGPFSYLPESSGNGWLLNERTKQSEAVRLPVPTDAYGEYQALRLTYAYTISPDQRVLARVHRATHGLVRNGTPPAGATQTASQPRLVIDQYDLDQHTTRRLTVEGVAGPSNELLPLTRWVQTDGRWELLARP